MKRKASAPSFHSAYHRVPDVAGQEELQAELERYAAALGVVKAAP